MLFMLFKLFKHLFKQFTTRKAKQQLLVLLYIVNCDVVEYLFILFIIIN